MARRTTYGRIDTAALTTGLALVLFGVAVMGFFETVLGSVHVTQRVFAGEVVIVHASFTPHGRAYLIALGFAWLFAWGVSRFVRAVRP